MAMAYLLISNLALALFFLIYRFGFKRLTFFNLNRWYLLGSIFIAYLTPLVLFIDIRVPELMELTLPAIDMSLHGSAGPDLGSSAGNTVGWENRILENWIPFLYWLGVLLSLVWLGYRLVLLLSRKHSQNISGNYSFFHLINIADGNNASPLISAHEALHIRQGHSYDILFVEIVRTFNWFNPILHWIRQELKFQHECIVDSHFSEDRVAYAELLIANAMHVHPHQLSHEFSNKSILKERINMIFKDKSKSRNRFLYLAILPMAVLLFGFSINSKSTNKTTTFLVADTVSSGMESASLINAKDGKTSNSNSIATNSQPIEEGSQSDVFNFDEIDEQPTYPGGINQFRLDVANAVVFPKAAIDARAKGKVELVFVIDKEGMPTDIKIQKDLGFGLSEAGIKALKKSKKWTPGKHKGKPAAVRYFLPLQFDLSQ